MANINSNLKKTVLAGLFLALAIVLPILTAQIPKLGNMLCPMHFPIFLCGFFCGPLYAVIVGIIAPLLRFLLFGAPVIIPKGLSMCAELAVYGLSSGLFYKLFPKRKIYIYITLIISMLLGRVVWGCMRTLLNGFGDSEFGWATFISAGFVNAIPGIVLQIILIPEIVRTLKKVQ